TTTLLTHAAQYSLAIDADGQLLLAGDGVLRRLVGTDFVVVKADAAFDLPRGLADGHSLAVDAKNRVYLTRPDQHAILRFDPATGSVTTLAGVGGQFFTGSSVDDGIKHPCRPVLSTAGDLY